MERKRTKYSWLLKRIAVASANGHQEKAERLFKKAWELKDDMNEVEQEVLYAQRYDFYGRPFENFICSEKADYYENQILAKQGL